MRKNINLKTVSQNVGADGLLSLGFRGLITPYALCAKKTPMELKRNVNSIGYAADLIMSLTEIKLSPFRPNIP
jgi:hypothetical protein